MRTALLVTAFVTVPTAMVISGCPAPLKPPFEWDPMGEFASPGTSFTLEEDWRRRVGDRTMILYQMRATGFSAEEGLHLWLKTGMDFDKLPASVTADGQVAVPDMGPGFLIRGYVPGQAFDLTLVSDASGKFAHARTIPFPIEARGTGGCSISVSVESESGHLFFAILQGFEAGEEVQITSQYKSESTRSSHAASERGDIGFPILFGRGDRGTATLTATGNNCTVSLRYNVGEDAIVPQ